MVCRDELQLRAEHGNSQELAVRIRLRAEASRENASAGLDAFLNLPIVSYRW